LDEEVLMRPLRRRLGAVRTSRFELFEPRLVMSTSPIGGWNWADQIEAIEGQLQQFAVENSGLSELAQARTEYGFTGAGQTVVVIDSGIAYSHTALGGGYGEGYRVVGGYDFAEDDDNPYDDGPMGAHGTHVAGIIGADSSECTGLAPGVDLVSLRVFDDAGYGSFAWVEEALRWVHEHLNSFANPITTVNLSIGSQWNSDDLPAWATLEDELAQLEADGIFVAVAAGNSFTDYNAPGLSYPAASSHVVPVSSVDSNGLLSYYSQRDARAIAAPGRNITSTVPDYLGNGNGIDDDYIAFSGTSMAAPYVAAASVLLREAYQFIGVASVNQQTLYTLMRNTADTIYDSVTGQNYLRLNLDRALDAIMPGDDVGSTADTARQLGTIVDTGTLSGAIGRLNDSDYFRFTAGATGTMTLSLAATGELQGQWNLVGASGTASADGTSFTFRVVAGQTYTFALSTRSGLGHYAVAMTLDANSGQSDHAPGGTQQILDQSITAAGKWFTVSAVNDGIFTVQALFANRAGDVDIELFDAQGNWLGGSYGTGSRERIDAMVTAGQTLFVHAYLNGSGTNSDVDLEITNLVCKTGSTVTVLGTDGDDVFQFIAGATHRLSINGVEYTFAGSSVSSVEFQGFRGSDSILLVGTSGNESARLAPGSVEFTGRGYAVQASSVETITLRGNGGQDAAALYDSAGDDVFEATPQVATLSGRGFSIRVEGIAKVRAVAKGGADVAYLHDSAGNDRLSVSPGYSRLSGTGFIVGAKDFETVHVFSTAGGLDRATFADSAGNDTFIGRPNQAQFWTGKFYVDATQFERVAVSATSGYDTATLYDSTGNDTFIGKPTVARLSGSGYAYSVTQFDSVEAKASSGQDIAYLYDSAGADVLVSTPTEARLSGKGFFLQASSFDAVEAYATAGGLDKATLSGFSGNATVIRRSERTQVVGASFSTQVRYFEEVYTQAAGGADPLALRHSASDDYLAVTADQTRLSNQDHAVWTYGLGDLELWRWGDLAIGAAEG
jgi:subtilisin family serine protease